MTRILPSRYIRHIPHNISILFIRHFISFQFATPKVRCGHDPG